MRSPSWSASCAGASRISPAPTARTRTSIDYIDARGLRGGDQRDHPRVRRPPGRSRGAHRRGGRGLDPGAGAGRRPRDDAASREPGARPGADDDGLDGDPLRHPRGAGRPGHRGAAGVRRARRQRPGARAGRGRRAARAAGRGRAAGRRRGLARTRASTRSSRCWCRGSPTRARWTSSTRRASRGGWPPTTRARPGRRPPPSSPPARPTREQIDITVAALREGRPRLITDVDARDAARDRPRRRRGRAARGDGPRALGQRAAAGLRPAARHASGWAWRRRGRRPRSSCRSSRRWPSAPRAGSPTRS